MGKEEKGKAIVKAGLANITIYADPALRTLALSIPAMAGLVGEENFNTLSHLRSALLKNAKLKWPLRSNAMNFLALAMKRWGVKGKREATNLRDAFGQFRVFPVKDMDPTRGNLEAMETGGTVAAPGMWVPFMALRQRAFEGRAAALRNWRKDLAAGKLFRLRGTDWIGKVREVRGRSKVQIVGRVMDARKQRAILGVHATFQRIWPEHRATYEKWMDMALTRAGRIALEKQNQRMLAGNAAWKKAYATGLASGVSFAEARKAASEAAKLVRKGWGK